MANIFTAWRRQFLGKRGLETPTGHPLYSYRLSAEEFADLEELLKTSLEMYLRTGTLGRVTQQIVYFPSMFVLYAAEWWRRRYDGSGWSWEPILSALEVPSDSWSPVQRSACIERGLREWKLELTTMHGFRFLGSVAFQGGLPMQLLGAARGNIGRVLTRVLRLASTGSVEASDIRGWIRSLSKDLPQAYRQDEIYSLLAEVIFTVLSLKREASLETADGAVAALDRFDSEWRTRFPIPVEDAQAQALIEQLIRDVAVVRFVRSTRKVYVERRLTEIDESNWEMESVIEVPEYIDGAELASLFSADATVLGRFLTLRLERGGETIELPIRRLAGHDRYRIGRRPTTTTGGVAISEHTVSLVSPDGQIWQTAIPKGEGLSKGLPWVFEMQAERPDTFRFMRQGSGSVSSTAAVLSLPSEWDVQPEEGGTASLVGSCLMGEREIWRITGNVRFEDGANRFRVRCGRADVGDEQLEWRGDRAWDILSRPQLAFRGLPVLCLVSEDGLARPARGSVAWRMPGGQFTRTPVGMAGPVEAVCSADGAVVHRSRILVLPDTARLRVEASGTPAVGLLRFSDWRIVSAEVDQPDVALMGRKEGPDFLAQLDYTGAGSPPEWCELTLYWEGNPGSARLHLPFPASGGRSFDADGNVLDDDTRLAVDRLHGVRLAGFLGNEFRATLEFRLQHGRDLIESTVKPVHVGAGQHRVEIRLIDHLAAIEKMLAVDDLLDDEVAIQLRIGNSPATRLRVARYSCEMHRLPSLLAVGLHGEDLPYDSAPAIRTTPVNILRLDRPGEEPIRLEPAELPETAAAWRVPVEKLEAGSWLVYPAPESELAFRPLSWPVSDTSDALESETSGLTGALDVAERSSRVAALDLVVSDLATDFLHPDWSVVAQLAGQLGHLPLATLEIWRCFAKSSTAMAALAIRMGIWPEGFVERFSTNMPWMWERVSFDMWKAAMRAAGEQCASWYGTERGQHVFSSHLSRRVEELSSTCSSLHAVLEVARVSVTGEMSPDVALSSQPGMDELFAEKLFSGANSRVQQLFHRNAELQWPTGLADELRKAAADWRAPYLCPTSYGFRDPAINAPVLIALDAIRPSAAAGDDASSVAKKSPEFHSFDPDWFEEAFDLTIARSLSKKDLSLE